MIVVLGLAVLACACERRQPTQNDQNRQGQQPRRGGCCETEKVQTPAVAAPQQQAAVAAPEVKAPEVKAEKAQ